jgi:lambda repressor-like predicted transcriptional regulator
MKTGFAAALSDQMKVKGWDIARLHKELDVSYEYARRLTLGRSFPSRFMTKMICKMLGLDPEKMWALVISDKVTQKYGAVPGKNARFAELERLLPEISEDQFQTLMGMVEGWAARNRRPKVELDYRANAVDAMFSEHTDKKKEKVSR